MSKNSRKSAVKRSPAVVARPSKKFAAKVVLPPAASEVVTPVMIDAPEVVEVSILAEPIAAESTPVIEPAIEVAAAPTIEAAAIETPAVEAIEEIAAAPIAAEPSPAFQSALWDLGSLDADTARDAASLLGRLGELAAVEPLIGVLNNTQGFYHVVVRAAAAESLGLLGDRRAIEPLLDAVADRVAEVSLESIRALALLGDARTIDALQQVVDDRTGFYVPMVRRAAEIALAQLTSR